MQGWRSGRQLPLGFVNFTGKAQRYKWGVLYAHPIDTRLVGKGQHSRGGQEELHGGLRHLHLFAWTFGEAKSCGGQQRAGLGSSQLHSESSKGSSAMVAAGGYPDGERVSVWYGNLYLQGYNNHKTHRGLTQLAEPWPSPAITPDIREMGCQLAPALCLYNTAPRQLLYAPRIPDCLQGK